MGSKHVYELQGSREGGLEIKEELELFKKQGPGELGKDGDVESGGLVLGQMTMNEPFPMTQEGRERSCEEKKRSFTWKRE